MERKLKGFILTIVITVICCGCGEMLVAEKAPVLDGKYSLHAQIETDGGSCRAEMTRNGSGCWSVRLLEPFELEGVAIEIDGDEIILSYGGTTAPGSSGEWLQSDFHMIISALEAAAFPSEAASAADSISVSGENYTLSFSRESRTPTGLVFPQTGISVEISDFAAISAD